MRAPRRVIALASLALCVLAVVNAAGAYAATYKATSTADTGGTCSPQPAPCTLRQAVNSATSGTDTITVPSGHYVLGSTLAITANVTINGTGASKPSIDGNNAIRLFTVSASVSSVTFSGVKLTGGLGNDGGALGWSPTGAATLNVTNSIVTANGGTNSDGGAIYLYGGGSTGAIAVNVTGSTFSSNSMSIVGDGGGMYVFGGASTTAVNIKGSTFSSNNTGPAGDGGGAWLEGGTGTSTVTVTSSTFSSNSTHGDGGAIHFNSGNTTDALTITSSTFSGNSATSGDGGAVYESGGGGPVKAVKSTFSKNTGGLNGGVFYLSSVTPTLTNDTFTDNSIANGEGGALYLSSAPTTLTNDTIAGNTVTSGGGDPGIFGAAGVTANNTIIADLSSGQDCDAAVASSDHSLQSGPAGCGLDRTGNPKLAALANNGGPTKTMQPLAGSAAIDAGHSTKCLATDQRGFPRPDNGESTCDIGAFEVNDDHSGPNITIVTPADGAHYKQGHKVNANYHCSDPSGVAFCQGPAPNGKPIDTSTTGKHSFTVQATDKLGHSSTKTVHYTVDSTETTPPVIKGFPPNQGCVQRGLKLKVSVHPRRLRLAAVFLDGKLIASSSKPNFKVNISGSGLKPGRHTVKIVREYKSGTKRRSTFSFASCRNGGRSPHIHTEGTPDQGTCTAKPFSIFVSITRVDAKTILVKLDGKKLAKPNKAKFTLSIDVPKLKVGKHRLVISAADKFKNGSVSITDFVRCA